MLRVLRIMGRQSHAGKEPSPKLIPLLSQGMSWDAAKHAAHCHESGALSSAEKLTPDSIVCSLNHP